MSKKPRGGISFNLISRNKLDSFNPKEKLQFIIEEVKGGHILVLEQGLTASEQAHLIEHTMKEIDHDTFIGIEMEGYGSDAVGFFKRVFGLTKKPRMTVIGPAHLLKMVHKDNDLIETAIIPGKGVA